MDHPFLCYHVLVVMTLIGCEINPLNAELNPIYHFLALLEAHPVLHISVVMVKGTDCSLHVGRGPLIDW